MTGKPTSWWTDEKDGSLHGQDDCGITVAYVRFAKPGDVEGGLGALARFLIETQGAKAPPLAPGGWYWQGTVEKRGVWNRPQGPFETAEEARVACESYPWREA